VSELQVLPIVKVDARYGPFGGKYPERVRIAMADGTTQWYVKEVIQPAPVLKDQLDQFSELCIGYERK
jgi:hypothetical protein